MCFLTNGGGVTEAQKAEQLSNWLDVSVGEDQVSCGLVCRAVPCLSVLLSSACMPALLLFVKGTPGMQVPALLLFGAINSPNISAINLHVCMLQVVLSHTPFRELVKQFGDSPVVIAGRGRTPEVAEAYGFRKAVTTAQLEARHPHALPVKGVRFSCCALTAYPAALSAVGARFIMSYCRHVLARGSQPGAAAESGASLCLGL